MTKRSMHGAQGRKNKILKRSFDLKGNITTCTNRIGKYPVGKNFD